MSAIWGTITFHSNLPSHVDSIMSTYYSNNCKLDRSDFILHPNLYFACGIQHLTPEARKESLPYFDTTRKIYFTADCLLDNRVELLDLLGEEDKSIPDGQLMLSAYCRWGIDFLKHLRGLFSFAIYDIEKATLYLATDQLSSRCLYYHQNQDQLTFSTLLTPILSLHKNIEYNELYFKDFLTAPGLMPNVVPNETPYQQVYKLNPGTYLEVTPSRLVEHCYWQPSMPLTNCQCRTPEEYGTYFKNLYEACIQDALRTDGNVGIALSSGLDSASVGALAADLLHKNKKNLYTYTYIPYQTMNQDKNINHIHNEKEGVLEIVRMHPNMIPQFLNNKGKNCFEEIMTSTRIMEIPYKAYANLPSLLEIYESAASKSCKIMLSGQLGNNTVSNGYIDNILFDLYSKGKYLTFLLYLNRYCKTVKQSRKQALINCIRYYQYAKKQYRNLDIEYTPDNPFLTTTICNQYPLEERHSKSSLYLLKGKLPVSQNMYLQYLSMRSTYTYMGELETKLGLAFGMVLRDPTKDMRILNFCYHLPYHIFAYQGIPRWLVRNQAKDILPATLLNNWLRYGVQNSDCHERLIRDWVHIHPKMKEQLSSIDMAPWINIEAITDFMNRTQSALSNREEHETKYLMILNVLYSFYQRQQHET